jgi:AcrR family transcriptional regulator
MGRWEPDSLGRLQEAALELFAERGYEHTTVAEIAARAGLTERTFFRYFADKREVLFLGAGALHDALVDTVAGARATASPMEVVTGALLAMSDLLKDRRDGARRRQSIIAASAELRERELIKLASLATTLATALRTRGVQAPAASLAAEAGIAVFRVAFERWVGDAESGDLAQLVRASLVELQAVAAGA